MRNRNLFAVPAAIALGALIIIGCPPWLPDDDDETETPSPTPTEVPGTPTPTPEVTPTPVPSKVAISGDVIAVDRNTGQALDTATYLERACVIVVYALPDPSDLVHPVGKATLSEPGFYSMDVPENSGNLYVVAVADLDCNDVISPVDVSREATLSPVAIGGGPAENVDIILDVAPRDPGGGGPGPGRAEFSGIVTYESDVPTDIAVVAFPGDFSGWYWGMTRRVDSGDYLVSITMWGSTTSLIGYADFDGNGVFEPSDPAGLPKHNPYALGPSGAGGVDIVIEGVGPIGLPVPLSYVSVSGTVIGHDTYADTPIYVTLTGADGTLTFGRATLSEPGNFTIRSPGNLNDVTLTAITDSNGDGTLDPSTDANGSVGPFSLGASSVGGKNITLVQPVDPETGFTGVIDYTYTASSNDILVVGAYISTQLGNSPNYVKYLSSQFPVHYEFLGLDETLDQLGVDSAVFYVNAVLDIGGDLSEEAGPEDVFGLYTQDGANPKEILVQRGKVATGVNFTMGNWTPGN